MHACVGYQKASYHEEDICSNHSGRNHFEAFFSGPVFSLFKFHASWRLFCQRLFSQSRTCFSSFCSDKSYFFFKPHGRYHFLQEAFANPSILVQTLLCFPTYTTLCFKADLLVGHAYLDCKLRRPGTVSVSCSSLSRRCTRGSP